MTDVSTQVDEQGPPTIGFAALAQFLRENPGAEFSLPVELAARFDVSEELVRDVLDGLRAPQAEAFSGDSLWKASSIVLYQTGQRLANAWQKARSLFMSATNKPITFVLWTALIALFVVFIAQRSQPPVGSRSDWLMNLALTGFAGTTVVTVGVLQLLCFARHGMARYPLMAALVGFLICTPILIASVILGLNKGSFGQPPGGAPMIITLAFIGCVVVAGIYGGIGVSAAMLGGYLRLRLEAQAQYRATRQELLARMFQLEERLSQFAADPRKIRRRRSRLHRFRRSKDFWLYAAVVGVLCGALDVLLTGVVQRVTNAQPGEPSLPLAIVRILVQPATWAAFGLAGYIAGTVRKSILVVALMVLASDLPRLFPWEGFGLQFVAEKFSLSNLWVSALGVILFGALVGIGAVVEEKARRERRLRTDDPAALLAELVRIQWRLSTRSQSTCVVSVDVVRSRAMKVNEDPLLVEWSFREYLQLVERVTAYSGGTILSTAGDGAILTFNSCTDALRAGKAIHAELSRFNVRSNRLSKPFQVRVGIHTGKVSAELNEVQFNEVIDVAAHVEAAAPAGGIAVTKDVAEKLPDERMAEVMERVDGQQVYFVLNPVEPL